MSAEALPIATEQFATALETLPLANLYAKTFELRNSIAHLQRSNAELELYSTEEGGDPDCMQAIEENKEVIGRMKERIELVKLEVEKRGARWHESDEPQEHDEVVENATNGQVGDRGLNIEPSQTTNGETTRSEAPASRAGGRLTDDQLRQQILSQLEDEDDGVHL